MIDLAQRSGPYEISLPYGLAVTVKPLITAGMAAAQSGARRAVEAIERQARERTAAGLALDGLPDLSAEAERDGFYQAQLIRELAIRHITGWTGVNTDWCKPCGDRASVAVVAAIANGSPTSAFMVRSFRRTRLWLRCERRRRCVSGAPKSPRSILTSIVWVAQ